MSTDASVTPATTTTAPLTVGGVATVPVPMESVKPEETPAPVPGLDSSAKRKADAIEDATSTAASTTMDAVTDASIADGGMKVEGGGSLALKKRKVDETVLDATSDDKDKPDSTAVAAPQGTVASALANATVAAPTSVQEKKEDASNPTSTTPGTSTTDTGTGTDNTPATMDSSNLSYVQLVAPTTTIMQRFESQGLKPLKRPPMSKAREIRLEQNRKAARESRRRKKIMIEELQRSVIFFSRANNNLKTQNDNLQRMLLSAKQQISVLENRGDVAPTAVVSNTDIVFEAKNGVSTSTGANASVSVSAAPSTTTTAPTATNGTNPASTTNPTTTSTNPTEVATNPATNTTTSTTMSDEQSRTIQAQQAVASAQAQAQAQQQSLQLQSMGINVPPNQVQPTLAKVKELSKVQNQMATHLVHQATAVQNQMNVVQAQQAAKAAAQAVFQSQGFPSGAARNIANSFAPVAAAEAAKENSDAKVAEVEGAEASGTTTPATASTSTTTTPAPASTSGTTPAAAPTPAAATSQVNANVAAAAQAQAALGAWPFFMGMSPNQMMTAMQQTQAAVPKATEGGKDATSATTAATAGTPAAPTPATTTTDGAAPTPAPTPQDANKAFQDAFNLAVQQYGASFPQIQAAYAAGQAGLTPAAAAAAMNYPNVNPFMNMNGMNGFPFVNMNNNNNNNQAPAAAHGMTNGMPNGMNVNNALAAHLHQEQVQGQSKAITEEVAQVIAQVKNPPGSSGNAVDVDAIGNHLNASGATTMPMNTLGVMNLGTAIPAATPAVGLPPVVMNVGGAGAGAVTAVAKEGAAADSETKEV